jgi:hypothetical protein
MTINKDALNLNASANTAFKTNKRIGSQYDIPATFGTVGVDLTELEVCHPVGFNKTTGKHAPWMAPSPTTVVVDLSGVTAGTWILTVNGIASASFAYDVTAVAVTASLRDIGYIATVTLAAGVYTIVFDDEQDIITPPTVTGATTNMLGEFGELATVTPGTQAVATYLTLNLGGATGGDYTITVNGETTAAIAFGANKATIEAALATAPTSVVAVATVGGTIVISFGAAAQLITLPTVSADLDGLTGDTNPTAVATAGTAGVPTELEIDLGDVTGGTFTITVGASTTAAIAYNASAAQVVTAVGLISVTVTDVLADGVHTITFGAAAQLLALPTVSATLTALTGANADVFDITAGTASYGKHRIVGFVNPNPVILSDTDDVLGVICVKGVVSYAAIAELIDSGDITALQTALKNELIPKGLVIQGLAGIH